VYLSDIIRWKDTTMSNTTPEIADLPRRDFLRLAGIAAAATTTLTAGAMPARAATAVPAIRQIDAGVLNIGYLEYGPASGKPVLLFHGWPYDIHAFAEVAPLLAARGHRVIVPHLRGHGTTLFRSDATPRNAQQAALAADGIALMDALGISKAVVAGFDWGARTADIMAVLWPERCRALVSVSGYLIGSQAANAKPLPPPPNCNGGISSTSPRNAASWAMRPTRKPSTGRSGIRLRPPGPLTMRPMTVRRPLSPTRTMSPS
jgi:pimeloyl-ACP methyl ester carboxylesterase